MALCFHTECRVGSSRGVAVRQLDGIDGGYLEAASGADHIDQLAVGYIGIDHQVYVGADQVAVDHIGIAVDHNGIDQQVDDQVVVDHIAADWVAVDHTGTDQQVDDQVVVDQIGADRAAVGGDCVAVDHVSRALSEGLSVRHHLLYHRCVVVSVAVSDPQHPALSPSLSLPPDSSPPISAAVYFPACAHSGSGLAGPA